MCFPRSGCIPVLVSIMLAGCSTSPRTEIPTEARPVVAMVAVSGDAQSGRAGFPLADSLRVLVTVDGRPAAAVPVRWVATHGAIIGDGVTDASGMAAAAWRLPTSNSSSLRATARLSSQDGGASVDFRAAASFPTLTLVAGGGQRGPVATTLPVPIRLRATWQGRPVVGDSIRWFGGFGIEPIIEPLDLVTDSSGEVAVRWTLDHRIGSRVAFARLARDGVHGPALGVTAEADPGPPAKLSWAGRMNTPTGEAVVRGFAGTFYLEATVTDRFGNGVVGVPVHFRLRDEGGQTFREVTGTSGSEGITRVSTSLESPEVGRPFRTEATIEGLPTIEGRVDVLDLMFTFGPMGDYLVPGNQITVPVGTTVRWGSRAYDHDCRRQDGSGEGGLVGAGLSKVLEVRYDQPGSYLWSCSDSGYPDAWLVWIHVTP